MSEQAVVIEKAEKPFYNLELNEIYRELSVNPENGLSAQQAIESSQKYGLNVVEKVKKSIWKVIIAPIINLLIIIYLISAFAMWALGEVERTTPTFVILGANAVVAIVQQLRAEKQLQALQKLSEATATVIRDGKECQLPTFEIVVGDIVKLKQGDKIPADCRIIESSNLSVDESSLTGESEPVKKNRTGDPLGSDDLPLQDQKNMIFLGTFISVGSCSAIVVKVGSQTEIGKISTMLSESSTGEIPLRKKMNNFAKALGVGIIIILILSIIYKTTLLSDMGMLNGPNLKIAMIDSIDLGMKVMPINLPLLTTIVLLTGVLAMAKKGVIVRELSKTESLGRVSIVCSDKTGTLTKNEMTVLKIWTLNQVYFVSGFGYAPEGHVMLPEEADKPVKNEHLDLLILSGYLNNNSKLSSEEVDTLGKDKTKTSWSITGLPTEASLIVLGKKYDSNIDQRLNEYQTLYEFNFDSSIKRMSKLMQKEGKITLFTKGATEWILPLCDSYYENGAKKSINEEIKSRILTNMQDFAAHGYRILSITYREMTSQNIPKDLESDNARAECEQKLTYLGFVVILDPPRDDVFDAVADCKSAGITVIMITGDSISTGKAIAEQLGIYKEGVNLAVEGKQLEGLSDNDFKKVTCYGRVSPEHKQIIVKRYQGMGKIVSMSGDGVNDALALSMADCGLAMGIAGTEVAKEAADMVITDDSFSTIITGVKEGRGLFMKIRTIVYFFICISVMEAVILFTSSLNPNPLFAMWDYWQLNMLYVTAHMFPSLGFTFGNNSKKIMEEKPRDSAEIITKPIFGLMIIHMLLMGVAIELAYWLSFHGLIPLNSTNLAGIGFSNAVVKSGSVVHLQHMKARTMAFMVLFILESFFMPLQIRRINQPLKESLQDIDYKKEFLFYLPSVLLLLGAIYNLEVQAFIGNLGWTLNFMWLSITDWLLIAFLCIPAIFGFEIVRLMAKRKGIFF